MMYIFSIDILFLFFTSSSAQKAGCECFCGKIDNFTAVYEAETMSSSMT